MISFLLLCGAIVGLPASLNLFWKQTQLRLKSLESSDSTSNAITLIRSPTRLSSFELVSITCALIKKYISVFTGNAAPLKADPTRDQRFALPPIHIRGLLDIDSTDYQKFQVAVSATSSGSKRVGSLSPFFLVASTGPLVPYILSRPECPIQPVGAVNTRNTFAVHDPTFCRDFKAIMDASQQRRLAYVVGFGGAERAGERRPRGVEFPVTIQIFKSGQLVLSQNLYFLQFLSASVLPAYKKPTVSTDEASAEDDTKSSQRSNAHDQVLKMSPQHPRTWAACCRDYNPIHISVIMAKIFGFKSVIAHGNHAVALVMQQLLSNDRVTDGGYEQMIARRFFWETARPFLVDMKFLKPMVLPLHAKVSWSTESTAGTVNSHFKLQTGKTQFVVGSCRHA